MQKCITCGNEKHWSEFNKNKCKKTGYAIKCRQCMKIYRKAHYEKNKVRLRKENDQKKKEIVTWFQELKKTLSCKNCGFSHPAAIDFHHTRDKEHLVSSMAWHCFSKQNILKEIEKCEILCSNCHRIRHYNAGVA